MLSSLIEQAVFVSSIFSQANLQPNPPPPPQHFECSQL